MVVARRAAAAFRGFLYWRTEAVTVLLGLALFVAGPGVPAAQQDAVDPLVDGQRLSDLVRSKAYLDGLATYLTGYETWLGPCPSPKVSKPVRTLVLQGTIRFPGVAAPTQPQWVSVVRITGCARPYERAVYATVHRGKPVFHANLMGSTRADPALQQRALKALVGAEKLAAEKVGCEATHPVRILTTAFGSEAQSEYGKSWEETWTIANCRGAKRVMLRFTPDHSGAMAIEISGRKVD